MSLAGVALGGLITFGTQWFTRRQGDNAERRRQAIAQAEARRTERIALLDRFLTAAQAAERVATDRHHGDQGGTEWDVRASAAMDKVWIEQKMLDLVSSPAVRAAVFAFALKLDHVVWQGPGAQKVWEFLNETRGALLDAAKNDLHDLSPRLGPSGR